LKGIVFNIQRFSIHDGPGIRTTVFFKGCNLRCIWCHNPEGIDKEPEIQFNPNKCILCGNCVEVCPTKALKIVNKSISYDRNLCEKSGKCTEVCNSGAIRWIGKILSVDEVYKEIAQDIVFYKTSDGGVTFSGGEPLLQNKFLLSLLKRCKENNIHTAVDTAGNVSWKYIEEIIPYTDLFLYDVKLFDNAKHKKFTGSGNKLILKNLKRLDTFFEKIIIRIPVIPQVNDSKEEIENISTFLAKLKNIKLVELLSFHQMGEYKYDTLGKEYKVKDLKLLSYNRMEELKEIFIKKNLLAKIH
jgi:pyruvate formate lyase activating enzyme